MRSRHISTQSETGMRKTFSLLLGAPEKRNVPPLPARAEIVNVEIHLQLVTRCFLFLPLPQESKKHF